MSRSAPSLMAEEDRSFNVVGVVKDDATIVTLISEASDREDLVLGTATFRDGAAGADVEVVEPTAKVLVLELIQAAMKGSRVQ